ncbi:MAG: PQQ-dependent sugar dehydrogenase [Chthoniobacterales bacterium]
MRRLTSSLLVLLVAGTAFSAPVDPANFSESVYVSSAGIGLMTGMQWAPDGSGRLFVIRKGGFSGQQTAQVRIVQNGAVLPTPFASESVFTSSECGLIGMAFDPDFVNNGYVYFFVTSSSSQQKIVRYTASGNVGINRTEIVTGLPTNGANHDGGAVGIGNDGRLYWAIGDLGSGVGVNADLLSLAAKIGRVNRFTGAALNDNPFFGQGNANTDKIWARGFRNPFTFTFQVSTGQLWSNTVGTTWEQVFLPGRETHSGWNTYENNQPAGFLPPAIAYRTNGTDSRTIAASGAVRANGVVTITTTAAHPFRKGGGATISGTGSGTFNGFFPVASVPSATSFTYVQAGANETSGGGTATTQNIGGAITGGCFYDSTAFPAAYRGNYFFGDYNSGRIVRVPLDAANTPIRIDDFVTAIGSHVDMTTGPDGALYYANQSSPGTIRRLAYTGTAQNLIVHPTALNVVEGGSSIVSVRLAAAPASNVTVTVERTSGDLDLTVASGATLTFTPANFATPQFVTLAAAEDADLENDSAVFRVLAPGIANYDLLVNGIDNDEPQLVVSATSLTVNEGSSNTFTVRLANAPAANTTVTSARTAGDSDVTVSSGASLTFTPANFATPQTVTIAAAEDPDNTNDSATITVSTPGEVSRNVAVTVIDNDPLAPAFTSSPILNAVDDANYTYDANADGNPAPTFSLTTAPAGMSIDATTGVIHWLPSSPGNFNVVVQAANGLLPNATQAFTISVNADQPPTAVLTRPVAGEILSGTNAEFFGDGLDDVSTVKAEFFVDGVLRYTDVNNGNHFHFGGAHTQFDTTQFTTGSHLLRMRVTDTKGQTAEKEVRVTFGSGGASPPTPQSAVSRKVHGPAGVFDINLPLSGAPGIESRSGGATGDHQVVVTFASPVTVNGNFQADVIAGTGAIGAGGVANNGMVSVSGSSVTIPLTNVTDVQRLTLMLFNVNDGAGAGDVPISLSLLAGDTNGSGQVTGTDISQTKAFAGGPVNAGTFRADVVVSGAINSTDIGFVKANSGNVLPAAPATEKRSAP